MWWPRFPGLIPFWSATGRILCLHRPVFPQAVTCALKAAAFCSIHDVLWSILKRFFTCQPSPAEKVKLMNASPAILQALRKQFDTWKPLGSVQMQITSVISTLEESI